MFVGKYDGIPVANRAEVNDYKWVEISELMLSVSEHPEIYTEWFKICITQVLNHMQKET